MSIVAYYLDVDAAQLATLKATPSLVWNIHSDPRFAKASMIDNDKDWEILSWLASPEKRAEKCHETAWKMAHKKDEDLKVSRDEFKNLVAMSAKELGCPPETQEADSLLKAIEGRGAENELEPALNFGLGAARVFRPDEVKLLAVSFEKFDLTALRKQFDRKEMARFEVGGMDWETEPDQVLEQFLVPSFEKVSNFYQRASQLNHYVLVIYQ